MRMIEQEEVKILNTFLPFSYLQT